MIKTPSDSFNQILKSLDCLSDTYLIFTDPNADAGYLEIKKMIRKFVVSHHNNSIIFFFFGHNKFFESFEKCQWYYWKLFKWNY